MYMSFFSCSDSSGLIGWSEVKSLFKEHGCVWMNCPEMRWYEESWGALMKGELADPDRLDERHLKGLASPGDEDDNFSEGETIAKLRAICLLMMYLGFCKRGFDEHCYPPSFEDMLDELKVDPVALANLAGVKMPDINMPDGDSFSFHDMWHFMEAETWDSIKDEVRNLIGRENKPIYDCLEGHYGGESLLFVALWNSRKPLWAIENADFVLSEVTLDKLDGFSYVQDGMDLLVSLGF